MTQTALLQSCLALSMASNYKIDVLTSSIKTKLNADQVKLWLSPYTGENGEKDAEPVELVQQYSTLFEESPEIVAEILENLRMHSVEKLAARQRFQKSGIASFKVKLAGHIPENAQLKKNDIFSIESSLNDSGLVMKVKVAERAGIDVNRLKLICTGKVVKDSETLGEQNIKNLAIFMALCLSQSEAEAQQRDKQVSDVAKTRAAAQLLSAKEDDGNDDNSNFFLQVADQNGKVIDLPKEERKALALAMALHEKGKAAMKKKNYGEGLLLLLEADSAFRQCRSSILEAVDNYAILCLDIVWCHLCLKNFDQLHDAEARLKTCDDCFRKSYGPNLERLALVRGGTGMERALFMRLHLLQGILAFHTHQRNNAASLLSRAEKEMQLLAVNEDAMNQVMSMGFSTAEARLGLRVCEGNITLAVAHIMKRKEERQELRKKERVERKNRKTQRKLGKTASGADVNVQVYESLLSMGFPKGASAEALRQANNDVTNAIQILQEHPEFLNLPDPEKSKPSISDEMISQVVSMGFEPELAQVVLHQFGGDVEKAVEELLNRSGDIPQSWVDSFQASTSNSTSHDVSVASTSPQKSPEELQEERQAIENIVSDIPDNEEAHLDLTLEEEAQFLQEYKALLNSL